MCGYLVMYLGLLRQRCPLVPRRHRARQLEHDVLSLVPQLTHVRYLDEDLGSRRQIAHAHRKHFLHVRKKS